MTISCKTKTFYLCHELGYKRSYRSFFHFRAECHGRDSASSRFRLNSIPSSSKNLFVNGHSDMERYVVFPVRKPLYGNRSLIRYVLRVRSYLRSIRCSAGSEWYATEWSTSRPPYEFNCISAKMFKFFCRSRFRRTTGISSFFTFTKSETVKKDNLMYF